MASLSSKVLVVVVSLCFYIRGMKGRPTNLKGDIATEDQQNFEESDLLKRSKTRSGGEQRVHTGLKGRKKQVIDAFHLGPYHHGHPWGTVSHWPGFHWGGQPAHHGGWTGYPILGGWHRSRISKKDAKTSEHRAALKRQVLPTFTFPTYGLAYPSLAFATVPFTPTIIPWGYGVYRSNVPEKTSKGQTRSSVKGSSADKRWWPGYMGGWGGWGIGNEGYPGWGPLGDFWGHGFDTAGLGHGWGVGFGDVFHPFLRSDVPGKQNKKSKAEKRWWPGYMGGWGGWGLGNTGYPGWGPLGSDLVHGLGPYGFGHGLGYYGYGHGWGLYGPGHGFGPGYGQAGLADISGKKKAKEEEAPKRQFIQEPYGGFGYPLNAYAEDFPYGPFGTFGSPFFGHGAYVPYPEALYGGYSPYDGFGPYSFESGFLKSHIPSKKSKKVNKEAEKDEEATGRHLVVNFNPGRYGWGGAIYPGHGYNGAFPLLGAFTYGGLYGGYYGPYGPPRVPFRPYHRSNVPDNSEENIQSREVINYHPGCYGWGGCIYPGSGPIGGWTWPLPCHFRHHLHHCVPCWTRSEYPKTQNIKEEKGKSRQEIADPGPDEGGDSDTKDPQTHPHLEGADLLNSEMQSLAMGFPGIEKLQTPMGVSSPAAQGFSNQDTEENSENASTEPATSAEATPEQATESTAGTEGITPDESGNGFRSTSLENVMEQPESQQASSQELLSSFNFSPSEGEAPADAFSDTGNPNMYGAGTVEQSTESATRRADIPAEDDGTLIKKQAVTYPYGSFYPGYMMAHGINPFYHYTPINYLQPTQHVMAYPSVYPVAHPGLVSQPLAAERPSHSIHVGAPNVNIDVHTTRGRIAQNPEKQKGSKLKHMMADFSKKLKLKDKKAHSSKRRRKEKRQIPSAFSSPIVNRPMGFPPQQFRYPISNTASFIGQSVYPSLQQQTQPFNMNTMTRSGLPSLTSPAMETTSMGISPLRSPLLRSSLNPAQMAFARQLSGITGISVPISAQPGMGIVGMASRKKRSPSKKGPKRPSKSTKRQFLAGMPQGFTPASISPFAMQGVPFMGIGLPALPSIPSPQTRPLAFRSSAKPSFRAWKQQRPQPGLSAMRVGSFPRKRIPELAPFNGFPSYPNIPFMNVPQPPNVNFFNGGLPAPWPPVAPGGQLAPGAAFGGGWEGFPRSFQGNQGPLSQYLKQQGAGGPFQMNGEQSAGFNPSGMNFIEQQPTPMFSEDGRAYQTPGQFQSMGSQSETASFFGQMPTEGGLIESNNFNMQSRFAGLKKSSVPNKKHNKGKSVKSKTDVAV